MIRNDQQNFQKQQRECQNYDNFETMFEFETYKQETNFCNIPTEMTNLILFHATTESKYFLSLTCKKFSKVFLEELSTLVKNQTILNDDGPKTNRRLSSVSWISIPMDYSKKIFDTCIKHVLIEPHKNGSPLPNHWLSCTIHEKWENGVYRCKMIYHVKLQYLFAPVGTESMLNDLFFFGHIPNEKSFFCAFMSKNLDSIRWHGKHSQFISNTHLEIAKTDNFYAPCEVEILKNIRRVNNHVSKNTERMVFKINAF